MLRLDDFFYVLKANLSNNKLTYLDDWPIFTKIQNRKGNRLRGKRIIHRKFLNRINDDEPISSKLGTIKIEIFKKHMPDYLVCAF